MRRLAARVTTLLPLVVLTFLAAPVRSQTAQPPAPSRDALVVSPAWLAARLTDPALVVLHVGDRAEYDAGHIPGARYVALSDLASSDPGGDGLTLEMLPADTLRRRLAALGVSDGSRVVVSFGGDRIAAATRVLFTLDHAGLGANASLLDGGLSAWAREGHPVTAEATPPREGTLAPLRLRPTVVDAARVRQQLGARGVSVVDARATAFYDGTQVGGPPQRRHRAGHVAGAKSVPFTELTDARLALKPAAELAAIFAKAGVRPGDTVIGYCHIGQQATALLFAARTLGHPVLLYDGSFEDWSRRAELPVEGAPVKK